MEISEFRTEEEYLSQMERGALLNPRMDPIFKAMLTRPTEESRGALKSFLEAATERKIKSFELVSNDAPASFTGQRGVNYDIACVLEDGTAADIEMQALNQKYDYGKRAEYQVARLETTYLKRGDDWEKAPTVYQISVLNFNYFQNSKNVVSRFAMRTKDGLELSNSLNVVFVELTKVSALEKSLDTNSKLENWALFLKDADNPKKHALIDKLAVKEEGLMLATKSLSSISADRDLWMAQYRQEIAERDRLSAMNAATRIGFNEGLQKGIQEGIQRGIQEGIQEGIQRGIQEGIQKGIQKGIQEGIQEGAKSKALEMAAAFLRMGIPPEKVAEGTGLSLDEVNSIK